MFISLSFFNFPPLKPVKLIILHLLLLAHLANFITFSELPEELIIIKTSPLSARLSA